MFYQNNTQNKEVLFTRKTWKKVLKPSHESNPHLKMIIIITLSIFIKLLIKNSLVIFVGLDELNILVVVVAIASNCTRRSFLSCRKRCISDTYWRRVSTLSAKLGLFETK